MTKIDLMIFDFDGTLVRSGRDIAVSVNHTLTTLGIAPLKMEKIIEFVGDGVEKLIGRSLSEEAGDRFNEAMEIFIAQYQEHMLDTTEVYPGVRRALNHFHDKRKIILTNKRHIFTSRIAKRLKIADFFDEIIGADSAPYKKPDPRLMPPILKRYKTEKNCAVVIGDGVNDILLARNTGVLSCAFLNGLGRRDDLLSLKPDFSCEDISELMDIFC